MAYEPLAPPHTPPPRNDGEMPETGSKEGEMPAEKFYPPHGEEGVLSSHIEIGWHRDHGGVYATAVIYNTPDGPPITEGIPLDRSAINRLIRTLRRARDATYGRDE